MENEKLCVNRNVEAESDGGGGSDDVRFDKSLQVSYFKPQLCVNQNVEAESDGGGDDDVRFDKSLQELKGLRSQLHYAADYCESTFLNAKQKKAVVENTQEYVCRAIVTLVDHLGNVSAKLEFQLNNDNVISETELRLNALKQRVLTSQQYAHKLALTRLRLNPKMPSYHSRYISTLLPNHVRSNNDLRDFGYRNSRKISNKQELERDEDMPLFLHTCTQKLSLIKLSTPETNAEEEDTNSIKVLPVRDGLPILSRAPSPVFHFQGTIKPKRKTLRRKAFSGSDILSLMRRSKRSK